MDSANAAARSLTRVHADRDEGSEQVTQLLPGEPVVVERSEDGWAAIRTVYDYRGWVREEALGAGAPVDEARAYLGAPYEWGGMTEKGIDCSGLVHMGYRRAGRVVPRDAHQQEAAAQPVGEDDLRRGDLVFFGEPGHADHVAFWLGDGRILHATSRDGLGVVEEPLDRVGAGPPRFARL